MLGYNVNFFTDELLDYYHLHLSICIFDFVVVERVFIKIQTMNYLFIMYIYESSNLKPVLQVKGV